MYVALEGSELLKIPKFHTFLYDTLLEFPDFVVIRLEVNYEIHS